RNVWPARRFGDHVTGDDLDASRSGGGHVEAAGRVRDERDAVARMRAGVFGGLRQRRLSDRQAASARDRPSASGLDETITVDERADPVDGSSGLLADPFRPDRSERPLRALTERQTARAAAL